MNFDEAIKAHSDWKDKLSKYIGNPDKSLNSATVSMDNQCALGKWIYSDGQKSWGTMPEFTDLKKAHAEFHKQAGDLVRRADSGEKLREGSVLDTSSPYGLASKNVISLITKVKLKVKATGG